MTTIPEFLLARIAEDEAVVSRAQFVLVSPHLPDVLSRDRVLADCEAKRRIVGMYGRNLTTELMDRQRTIGDKGPLVANLALRALAAAYADHPDYDERWRP